MKNTPQQHPIKPIPYPVIAVDVETTGLDPDEGCRVIQIAVSEWREESASEGLNLQSLKSSYVIPNNDKTFTVSKEIEAINGISTKTLQTKGVDSNIVWNNFYKFLNGIGKHIFIAYNNPFDLKFINAELVRHNLPIYKPTYQLDLLVCVRALPQTKYMQRNLQNIAQHFLNIEEKKKEFGKINVQYGLGGKTEQDFHDAVVDSVLTALLLKKFLPEYKQKFTSWKQLQSWHNEQAKIQSKDIEEFLIAKQRNLDALNSLRKAVRQNDMVACNNAVNSFRFIGGRNKGIPISMADTNTLNWILNNTSVDYLLEMASLEMERRYNSYNQNQQTNSTNVNNTVYVPPFEVE